MQLTKPQSKDIESKIGIAAIRWKKYYNEFGMLLQIDSKAEKESANEINYKLQIFFENKIASFKSLSEINDQQEKVVFFYKLLEHLKEQRELEPQQINLHP